MYASINRPDRALDVYTKLREADLVTIDLERRGKPATLTIEIK